MPSPSLPADATAEPWQVALLALVCMLPVVLATPVVLRRVPEPDEPEGKPPYRELATPRFVAVCAVLAGLGAVLVGLTLPAAVWPLWWVLCVPVVVLVAVDARTTWLPLRLTRLCWAAGAGAAGTGGLLGGPAVLGRAALGATVAGALYLVVWRFARGQLGFGDVRLAPVLGAATAGVGWSTLLASVLVGSLVGAAVGIVLALRRRPGAFAYAPSMLAGAFGACALRLLSG